MDINQAPPLRSLPINLLFPAMRCKRRFVFFELRREIPIELSPSTVPVDLHGNITRGQLSLGEGFSHQTPVHVLFDLVEAVLMTQWMDKGIVRRVQPDLDEDVAPAVSSL
jgi:hypothetical protein